MMRTSTTNRVTSRVLALLFTFSIVATACSTDGGTSVQVDDFLNQTTVAGTDTSAGRAIDFRFETLDGEQHALSTLGDKPVVLNFFASWCPTCIAEMPDFEAVHQALGEDVQFLGLAFQDRQQNAEALVRDTGITYPAGLDTNGEVFALIDGLGMPTTVFIDADGVVQDVHSGALSRDGLTDLINEHLLS